MIVYGSGTATATCTRITTCPWSWRAAARADSRAAGTSDSRKETPLNNLLLNMLDKAGVPDGELRRQHRSPFRGVDEVDERPIFAAAVLAARLRCSGPRLQRSRSAGCGEAARLGRPSSAASATGGCECGAARRRDGARLGAYISMNRTSADVLLSAGAKVETADEYGETPLTLACANGNAGSGGEAVESRRERESGPLEWRDGADDRRRRRQRRMR